MELNRAGGPSPFPRKRARCSRLTRRAAARDHRVLPAIRATTHVEGKAISRRAELRSAPPAGDTSAGAPAVAGLANQRRRERRLIQKAPADSATRTPIHPAKRSSEDRCIVSGSSIEDEGIPDGAWSPRRSEPQRTSKSANRPSPARTSPLAPYTRARPPVPRSAGDGHASSDRPPSRTAARTSLAGLSGPSGPTERSATIIIAHSPGMVFARGVARTKRGTGSRAGPSCLRSSQEHW
jgi:hypothetical protein